MYSRLEKRTRGQSDPKSVAKSDQQTLKKERSESPIFEGSKTGASWKGKADPSTSLRFAPKDVT
jgi:hypothetical protein